MNGVQIYVDVETTGLEWSRGARIVEVAAVVYRNGVEIAAWDSLSNPGKAVLLTDTAAEALRINHLELDDILKAPPEEEVARLLGGFVAGFDGATIHAYNNAFDSIFLSSHPWPLSLDKWGECVMRCAVNHLNPGGRWMKLAKAAAAMGVEFDGQAHRALVDARVAAKIHQRIKALVPASSLVPQAATELTVVPSAHPVVPRTRKGVVKASSSVTQPDPKAISKLSHDIDEAFNFAQEVAIVDDEVYEIVFDFVKGAKAIEKELDKFYDPILTAWNEALKVTRSEKAKYAKPLSAAIEMARSKLSAYKAKCDAEQKEKLLIERAAAQRKAEEERKARLAHLAKEGRQQEAKALAAVPVAPVPVDIPASAPKLDGGMYRKHWKFRILDEKAIPREYLMPDEVKIGKVVRALGGETRIPGIEVFGEDILSIRE